MLSKAGTLNVSTQQPYIKKTTLDGDRFIFLCSSVSAIDIFLMNECNTGMTKAQEQLALDLIKYEDGEIESKHISTLDELFTNMVLTGRSCVEIQGGGCENVY